MEVRIDGLSFWESELARSSYAHKALTTYRDDASKPQSILRGKKLAVDNVNLTIAPGTVNCIHGYGLGPQNFIRVLALQPSVFGNLLGSISYDNSIRTSGSYCDIAFIPKRSVQSLQHIHVFDYLYFAARLRTTLGSHECRSRAAEAARIVGLDIGVKLQDLRMGQHVQLLIAAELVGQPTLICVEDPLSGLDEPSAQEVVDALSRIARRQHSPTTVVFTVSQPGHCLLRGVNRLVVFANARVVLNKDISAITLPLASTSSSRDKSHTPRSPVLSPNGSRFGAFSPGSPQPTLPLLKSSSSGIGGGGMNHDTVGSPEQQHVAEGDDGSAASDIRYIEDQICLALCSVETRLLAVAGEDIAPRVLLKTQREVERIVESVCEELSMFVDRCVMRLGGGGGGEEADNDTQEVILSPIKRVAGTSTIGSAAPEASHAVDKSRRQLRQGFGGGFVRAPKKTIDDVIILIQRSKMDLFNNRSRLFLIASSWVLSAIVLGIVALSIGDAASGDATISSEEGSAVLEYFSLSAAVLCVTGLQVLLISLCVPDLCKQLADIAHEVHGGYVHQVATWLSFLIGDMPIYLVLSILNASIVHVMLEFRGSQASYFSIISAQTLCFYSAALACAALSTSPFKAVVNYLRFCSISILFCGFYERIPELSIVWRGIADIFPSKWIYEALMLIIYDDLKTKDVYLSYYGFDDGSVGASVTWTFVWFSILAFISVVLLSPLTSKITRAPMASNLMRLKSSDYTSPEHLSPKKGKGLNNDEDGDTSALTKSPLSDKHMIDADDVENNIGHALSVDISTLQMEIRQRNTLATTIAHEYEMTLSFRSVNYVSNDFYQSAAYDDRSRNPSTSSVGNNVTDTKTGKKSTDSGIDSTVHGPSRDVILYDITGKVSPRSLCAIVDGSNEGTERILLRVLSGRADYTGKVSGDIAINGHIIPQGVKVAGVAFVAARDAITHGCLTVREALNFAALLRRTDQTSCPTVLAWKRRLDRHSRNAVAFSIRDRLPGKSGDLDDRVQEVIDLMGLGDVSEKIIGEYSTQAVGAATVAGGIATERGPMHQGITPYQMRCLTIGIELVNKPPLVFLENPFYGLDRYSSKLVAETLRSLAAGGRTLICSLRTPPPSHTLDSFDDLLLLGRGMLIYSGPAANILSYFDNLGFERREAQSPIDFVLDIISEQATLRAFGDRKGAMLSLEDLSALRRTMLTDNKPLGIIDDGNVDSHNNTTRERGENGINGGKRTASAAAEAENSVTRHGLIPVSAIALGPAARVMASRRWVTAYRTRMLIARVSVRALVLGLFFGSFYFQIDDGNATSRINLFSICYLYSVLFLAEMLPGAHRRQRDFLRERSAGSSASLSYWLSDGAPSNISCALQSLLFCAPLYPMVGLNEGFDRFAYFLLAMVVASLCNLGLIYLCSAMCATSANSLSLYLGVFVPAQYLFSGALISAQDFPSWLQWAPFVNPMHLYISGVTFNEFSSNGDATDDGTEQSITFDDVNERYGFETRRGQAVLRLVFIAVLYRILWFLVLKLREIASEKRRLRRYMGAARHRARRLVTAGLRWRRMRQKGYTVSAEDGARMGSIAGVSLIPVGVVPSSPDDYSMMTTGHGVVPVYTPKMGQSGSNNVSSASSSSSSSGGIYSSTSPRQSTSSTTTPSLSAQASRNSDGVGRKSMSDAIPIRGSSVSASSSTYFGSSGNPSLSSSVRTSDAPRLSLSMADGADEAADLARRQSTGSMFVMPGGASSYKGRFSDGIMTSSMPSQDSSRMPNASTSAPSMAVNALQEDDEGGAIDDDLLSPTYDDDFNYTM